MTVEQPWARTAAVLGALLAAMFAVAAPLFAQTMSIEEFVDRKEKWKDLQNVPLRVEGRYGFIGDQLMQFTNCDLLFLVPKEATRNTANLKVVEVAGRLITKDGKLAFQVESLSPRLSDLETVRQMRFRIDSSRPQEWHRVADWARKRGRFYKDDELLAEARELDRSGIQAEFRAIGPTDEQALATLLGKARAIGAGDEVVQPIVHESLRARWTRLESLPYAEAGYRDLAVRTTQELPAGAMVPLEAYPTQLAEQYAANPNQVYEASDASQRRVLHRLFYLTIVCTRILHGAAEDGSNGFEIVDRLKADAPERIDLARRYEQAAIRFQMARLDVMTRLQLLELVERLEQGGHSDLALEAKRSWLRAWEPRLRKEGPRGLVNLADLWLLLLNDAHAATQLYMEAWRADRQYAPARDWLLSHGFRLVADQWLPEAEAPVLPKSATELAIEQGRIDVGMTASEARAALGALPNSVTRIASSGQTTEIWVYDSVIVRLARPYRTLEGRVIAVEPVRRGTIPPNSD